MCLQDGTAPLALKEVCSGEGENSGSISAEPGGDAAPADPGVGVSRDVRLQLCGK